MAFTILPITDSKLGVKVKNLTTGLSVYFDLATTNAIIDLDSILNVHRLDFGLTLIDSRIIKPFAINISGFFEDIADLETAAKVIVSRRDYYEVTINGTMWTDVVAASVRIDQSADYLSVTPFEFVFVEIITSTIDYVITESPADEPTRNQGNIQPVGAERTLGNLIADKLRSV